MDGNNSNDNSGNNNGSNQNNAQSSGQSQMSQEESKRFTQGLNSAIMQKVNEINNNAGRDNVTAYNKNEQMGRTNLVDPSLTGQETQLPTVRRYEQAANLEAIQRTLPQSTQEKNQQILGFVQHTPLQLQQQLKQKDSIYDTRGNNVDNFMKNRLNIALMRNRVNSLYALV